MKYLYSLDIEDVFHEPWIQTLFPYHPNDSVQTWHQDTLISEVHFIAIISCILPLQAAL